MRAGEGLLRWLRQARRGRAIAARLGAGYIRLVAATTRWQVEGREHYDRCLATGEGLIAASWHGRLFLSPTYVPEGRHTVAMISNNRDGDVIAAIVARWGVETVRGSTADRRKGRDKGGSEAFAGAERALRAGALVAITPDGPRGPRMRAQPGAARLSILTGCPVVPVAFSARPAMLLGSWDRFLLPLPFGRGAVVYGAPLHPPGEGMAALEPYRRAIEEALTAVADRADALAGRAPVAPAPAVDGSAGAGR
jgi:hypothetical protein